MKSAAFPCAGFFIERQEYKGFENEHVCCPAKLRKVTALLSLNCSRDLQTIFVNTR